MQLLKDNLIRRIIRIDLSKREMIILLELNKCGDSRGHVSIYYKDVIKSINEICHCSKSQFYKCLDSLESMGFIERERNENYKNEISVWIIGNNFDETGYRNYTDINIPFFTDGEYMKHRAGAIRIALYSIFRVKKAKNTHGEDKKINEGKLLFENYTSYEKIAKRTNIKVRMVKEYIEELKRDKFLSIGNNLSIDSNRKYKKRYDIITVLKDTLKKPVRNITEKGETVSKVINGVFEHYYHCVSTLCRRHKINACEQEINDTAGIMNQYYKQAMENGKNVYRMIENAILQTGKENLVAKNVHYIMKSLINKDYSLGMVVAN